MGGGGRSFQDRSRIEVEVVMILVSWEMNKRTGKRTEMLNINEMSLGTWQNNFLLYLTHKAHVFISSNTSIYCNTKRV